jgi:hypothetical protein
MLSFIYICKNRFLIIVRQRIICILHGISYCMRCSQRQATCNNPHKFSHHDPYFGKHLLTSENGTTLSFRTVCFGEVYLMGHSAATADEQSCSAKKGRSPIQIIFLFLLPHQLQNLLFHVRVIKLTPANSTKTDIAFLVDHVGGGQAPHPISTRHAAVFVK